ncbi:hypothetical protein BRADI_4g27152v3 [Brachypodium distachyon]|uniref:Uncharacterized protein n=1 Tax=Brachypodium distachyon TaxID=15368 RepID=A0A2K2CQH0_BRADI|nr:hypothetical protein BRADI_4g27152v3 [Brachypodium distachyon]
MVLSLSVSDLRHVNRPWSGICLPLPKDPVKHTVSCMYSPAYCNYGESKLIPVVYSYYLSNHLLQNFLKTLPG